MIFVGPGSPRAEVVKGVPLFPSPYYPRLQADQGAPAAADAPATHDVGQSASQIVPGANVPDIPTQPHHSCARPAEGQAPS
jgi:hypothetical protein